MLYLRLSLLREPCSSLLGTLHPERNREDIAWFHMLHQGLIELAQEGKWVLCCLRYSLPLKDAVLAQVDGSFHLSGREVEPNHDRQVITHPQRGIYLLLVHRRKAS